MNQEYSSYLTLFNGAKLFEQFWWSWLVGCFGFNGPFRQYFSLYRAVSQREGERSERIDESKNVQTPPPTASAVDPCPTVIKIVGRPSTGSLPSTVAPPDHPLLVESYLRNIPVKLFQNLSTALAEEVVYVCIPILVHITTFPE